MVEMENRYRWPECLRNNIRINEHVLIFEDAGSFRKQDLVHVLVHKYFKRHNMHIYSNEMILAKLAQHLLNKLKHINFYFAPIMVYPN